MRSNTESCQEAPRRPVGHDLEINGKHSGGPRGRLRRWRRTSKSLFRVASGPTSNYSLTGGSKGVSRPGMVKGEGKCSPGYCRKWAFWWAIPLILHCLPTSDGGISMRPDLRGPVKPLLGRSDGSSRSWVKGGHHGNNGDSMGVCRRVDWTAFPNRGIRCSSFVRPG